MLTKRIIPCLDVKDGRVVKGVSFVNLRDAGDPVEVATVYDREGADELCFLDITASHENRKTILDVVERTAARVFMPVTVGGGVRKLDDIRNLLNAGADKVSINTAAVERPEFVKEAAERFGTQCIVVAIDAKRSTLSHHWEVFTHGGRKATGLDATTLMLVRLAALIAVDAPPASYMLNLGVASEIGLDTQSTRDVLAAVAPIVGTARTVSAIGKIVRAFGLALDMLALDDEAES